MSLRCFAGRSLAALCMTFLVECGVWAQQDADSVYTPSYFPQTPRVAPGPVAPTQQSTPLFRAILPVQAIQSPTPSAVSPPQPGSAVGAPAVPNMFAPGGAAAQSTPYVQSTPSGPIGRTVEPLDEAYEYVVGVMQTDWDDSAVPQAARWFNADYQLSWLRGQHVPPLVTASGASVPVTQVGVLGLNTTSILLGDKPWDSSPSSGFRLNTGRWLDNHWGVEVGGFLLEDKGTVFNVASNGAANSLGLGRPFLDTFTGGLAAEVVAAPGQLAGSIQASTRAQMWGSDINFVFREEPGRFFQTQLRAGVRYIDYDDSIFISQTSTPLGAVSIPFNGNLRVTNPDSVRVDDSFRTHNEFIGGQVGFDTSWKLGRLVFDLDTKVALGSTHQEVTVNGTSETISGGQTTNLVQGGFLANLSNIGHYSRDAFSAIPEIEFKVEYRCSPTLSLFASYDALIWQDVAMAGGQIPTVVDVTHVPTNPAFGAANGVNPGFSMGHSNFISQSLHAGVLWKF
jgi:Putative beta barrel porin-7 (BBP7)